ncbi:SRPBCC family protein [Streptomyces kebangsaanensis]|uniref:SRPBCC family protein n=1 Tax=Streptomyces kebangsaanensis TaxID=864058 RepID=A0ABW6KK62_9ACTN|nr:SRPBCC family protein [Streptomyces kebangsaanensis]
MSRLQEHIDVNAPAQKVWDQLHRIEEYSSFMDGVRRASAHGGDRARLDVRTSGGEQALEAVLSDRADEQTIAWQTQGSPELQGTLSVRSLDNDHSQVQVRMEYDPQTIQNTFGGPKGMAQVHAIERTVRGDLEHFRDLVEREKG